MELRSFSLKQPNKVCVNICFYKDKRTKYLLNKSFNDRYCIVLNIELAKKYIHRKYFFLI